MLLIIDPFTTNSSDLYQWKICRPLQKCKSIWFFWVHWCKWILQRIAVNSVELQSRIHFLLSLQTSERNQGFIKVFKISRSSSFKLRFSGQHQIKKLWFREKCLNLTQVPPICFSNNSYNCRCVKSIACLQCWRNWKLLLINVLSTEHLSDLPRPLKNLWATSKM